MTPREADRAIKKGEPILVTTVLARETPFVVTLVGRDRWNVETADGGLYDRGDMWLVEQA